MSTTVLIVDDHAGFREIARRMLEASGYEIVGGFWVATPVILPPSRCVRSADVASVTLKSHLSSSIQSTGAAMTTCVNRPVSSSTTTISLSVFYGRSFRTSVWGY